MKNLRFELRVYDELGEELVCDWTTISSVGAVDAFGRCEAVELSVAAALRALKRDDARQVLRGAA